MKSWKTTLFGALSACGLGLSQSTDPLLHTIGNVLGPISLALAGLFARDNNVTSEQAGADKKG